MYNLDGIDISDLNHDRVCLNCIHWQANTQLYSAAKGVICTITQEHTAPTDTCSQFTPNRTLDDIQDPNRWQDKSNKLYVYRNL